MVENHIKSYWPSTEITGPDCFNQNANRLYSSLKFLQNPIYNIDLTQQENQILCFFCRILVISNNNDLIK